MDKRAIIAFVLIGIILFFYGDYARWVNPPKPKTAADTTAVIESTPGSSDRAAALNGPGSLGVLGDSIPVAPVIPVDTSVVIPKRLITVETERYEIIISTDGGQIKSLRLKPYGRYLKDGVELIPDAPGARPGYRFWTNNGPIETESLAFRIEDSEGEGDIEMQVRGSYKETLTLFAPLGKDRGIKLTYTFNGDQFTFLTHAEGVGMSSLFVRDYIEAIWTGGLAYTEADTAQDQAYSLAYTYFAGDVLEEQKLEPKKSVATSPSSGQTRWGAVRTKYFLAAMIPDSAPSVGSSMESRRDSLYTGKFPPNRLGVSLRLPLVEGAPSTPIRLFVGPLDIKVLKEIDPTLTKTMNWGWSVIAPFSKAILWGLRNLYAIIPNYGICIIIFSIVIKLLIWPLTHKSAVSMAGMQRIQPKITEMKEKYKNDPQRLNKEMMKLYKEEKINPMGGCLPMLLQLPLLYALFIVFRSTIEFRQAPFFGWITDLSMPDVVWTMPFSIPLYGNQFAILPWLMAISTYYQSKSTITDPNQKLMIYMMPVMMLVFFNAFPSGYNLYFTLFNVWTVVQQKITPIPKYSPEPAK